MKKLLKLLIILPLLGFSVLTYAAPVNINTADARTLATNITGVGFKKAEAIVHYRKKHGPFKRVDDIVKVKGIGSKLLEKNRSVLRISSSN